MMRLGTPSLVPWRRHPVASALAVVAVLVLGAWLGRLAWREVGAARHWRAARAALETRDWAAARRHLAVCLEAWPDSGETHFEAARAARRAGDYADAGTHLRHCERLRWNAEAVGLEKDLARAQRGDLKAVEGRLLELAHGGHPDAALVFEALAQGYVETYNLAGALHCTDELLRLAPEHAQGHVWHGWVLEQLRRFDEARDDYRQAVALAPGDEWARLSLGEVLLFLHMPAEAVEQFEYLIARKPENIALRLGLARCRAETGRTAEARRLLDDVLKEAPDEPVALSERGRLALKDGDLSGAERLLRQAMERVPGDRQTAAALALCLEERGRPAEAAKYRAVVKQIEADEQHLYDLVQEIVKARSTPARRAEAGILSLRLGLEPLGLYWLNGALREDPGQPAAHRALADFYQRKGEFDRAARHRQLAESESRIPAH